MLTKFATHSLAVKTTTTNNYGEEVITYDDGGNFEGWIAYINYSLLENQGLDLTDITHECLVRGKKEFHKGDKIDGIYEIKFFQDDRRYTKLYLTEIRDEEPIPTEHRYMDGYEDGYADGYEQGSSQHEPYEGSYSVTPAITEQILETRDKLMVDDLTVQSIPYYETTNPKGKTVIIGGIL